MSRTYTLLIPLIGPMQSWGYRSRFDDRDTGLEPTRSGVVGLLCSALGWSREHDLAPFNPLKMAVRVDAPGNAMTDYHTAQNVLRAGGGIAPTVQSKRHYLSDARFLVGLEDQEPAFLQMLENALRNPVWTLYLGRKSFPLTEPPYLKDSSITECGLVEAFQKVSWKPPQFWKRMTAQGKEETVLRILIESTEGEMVSADYPIRFANREFQFRRVTNRELKASSLFLCEQEDSLCISHV